MDQRFLRTAALIGEDAVEMLRKCKIALFGLGGVGSFVMEGLVRAGVENFILVDNGDISISNIMIKVSKGQF